MPGRPYALRRRRRPFHPLRTHSGAPEQRSLRRTAEETPGKRIGRTRAISALSEAAPRGRTMTFAIDKPTRQSAHGIATRARTHAQEPTLLPRPKGTRAEEAPGANRNDSNPKGQ